MPDSPDLPSEEGSTEQSQSREDPRQLKMKPTLETLACAIAGLILAVMMSGAMNDMFN